MNVWVAESGDYEQRRIIGIYSSFKSAIEGIKSFYKPPYIVTWELEGNILTGRFEEVAGFSTKNTTEYEITCYGVE